MQKNCPCGSGTAHSDCCAPIISGKRPAATPEQLMRARYAAHVIVAIDFIFESTHPDHRQNYNHEGTKEWAESAEWLGLEILGTQAGGAQDQTGEVEFIARYRDKEGLREHHEQAHFARVDGIWYFTGGDLVRPQPLLVNKTGRNDPCPCGSGRKFKKCCGA